MSSKSFEIIKQQANPDVDLTSDSEESSCEAYRKKMQFIHQLNIPIDKFTKNIKE